MGERFTCRKCGVDLERWNMGYDAVRHCPHCGVRLLNAQSDRLWDTCTIVEVDTMIRKRVRAALEYAENECGGDFACKVWERENIDGVVFYSNYRADQFVVRHAQWVNEALEAACEQFGDDEHYAVMKAECNDRFLVAAFILATEYYLYQQLFVDANETITAARIEELRKLVKEINYDGGF